MRLLYRIRSLAILFVGRAAASADPASLPDKPKNVILMIGDGMGPSQFSAAWLYSNRVLGKELRMVEVMKSREDRIPGQRYGRHHGDGIRRGGGADRHGKEDDRPRVEHGGADGKTPVKTILEIAKDKGMATGLVTTSGITDATPAAFAAHVPHRSEEASVADQELRAGVDVLMGGRKQFFLPEISAAKRQDNRNLLDEARSAGYAVVDSAAELQRVEGGGFWVSSIWGTWRTRWTGTRPPNRAWPR